VNDMRADLVGGRFATLAIIVTPRLDTARPRNVPHGVLSPMSGVYVDVSFMSNFGITASALVVIVMSAVIPFAEQASADRAMLLSLTSDEEHLILAVSCDGSYWLNAKPIAITELRSTLSEVSWHPGMDALVDAPDASFAAVMLGMDAMREIGIREVGLVTRSWRPHGDVHSRFMAVRVFLTDRKRLMGAAAGGSQPG
jgi:biopolymer transport protein ExbD